MPNYWRPYAQATLKLEQKFTPYIIGITIDFREKFISDLQYHGKEYAVSQLSTRLLLSELTPVLTSIYKTGGVMGARMTAAEIKKFVTQKDMHQLRLVKGGGLGRNLSWITDVMNFLQTHMLKFVQKITDTMRDDILKILKKSTDNSWSLYTTVEELRKEGLIKARAEVIARTEINRAGNVGHSVAAKSLPYEVDKKWIGAGDHRERHSHIMTNNHTIDEFGYFEVPVFEGKLQIGTDHMQFPGDPDAHVSNVANCRCRVIYVPKRDTQGRLIMREQNAATIIPISRPTTYTPEQIAAQLKAHIVVTAD